MQRTRTLAWIASAAAVLVLAACAADTLHVPDPGAVPIPTLQTLPDDLALSPQLGALEARDTAGLDIDADEPAVAMLPAALDALVSSPDAPTKLTRVALYSDFISFTYEQNGINGRAVSANYYGPGDFVFSEPRFDDSPTFPISSIDVNVPAALVAAIEGHVPNARVTGMDLSVAQSYGYGLAWNIRVDDARGSLAVVFADPDGAIVGVDVS